MNLNKAFIAGNLTRDPELKSLPSGHKVVNFGVATNRYWKDPKTGEKKDAVEFHNVVAFGRQAEVIAQYLKKGRPVFVEGRLQTRSWDQDGVKKYKTEIVMDTFQFLDGGNGKSSGGISSADMPDDAGQVDAIEYPTEEINPEDIPF